MGDEAECLSEWIEGFMDDPDVFCTCEDLDGQCPIHDNKSRDRINLFKSRYDSAKSAKVGTNIHCPTCNKSHIKTTYHKVFCGRVRCKDEYWNTVDDKRRERAKKYSK